MTKQDDNADGYIELEDVSEGLSIAGTAISVAQAAGVKIENAEQHKTRLKTVRGAIETGTTVVAGSAAVASATTIGAAATSGAGITSALEGAGGVIGGGMALGPSALAAGPTYLGAKAINKTFFSEQSSDDKTERVAKKVAQVGTNVGGVIGIAGTGAAVVSGGASGAAIMSTLAGVGSLVGGGAIAGTAVLAAAPIAVAGGVGYGVYRLFSGGKKRARIENSS